MVLSLVVPLVLGIINLKFELRVNPHWTKEDLKVFVHFGL